MEALLPLNGFESSSFTHASGSEAKLFALPLRFADELWTEALHRADAVAIGLRVLLAFIQRLMRELSGSSLVMKVNYPIRD